MSIELHIFTVVQGERWGGSRGGKGTLLKPGKPNDAAVCERVRAHVKAGHGLQKLDKCLSHAF